jgi:hypothetical protein|tara:strand:- start:3795 stop:3974 length:180 start_codon:yes stop_codon:yes gene_type:complete
MNIDLTVEIKREVGDMIEGALQYGEGGDYRATIRNAKDLEELKTILSGMVDELLDIRRY